MAVRAALVLSVLSVALATGYAAGAAAAGAGTGTDALALADPGVFSLELGGFNSLEDVLAVESDDVWAVGDGIVHYSAGEWSQVAGMEGPAFHAIDGFSSDALWAVGEVRDVGCDRYGIVMRRDAVGWHSEPVGSHQPLFDVAMVSETEGWAVGGIDVPVILHYDGERWSEVGAPETGGLFAVHLTSARSGWAVGDRGAIVRFDGRDWIAARSPTYSRLLDVHMLDEETGWAVGEGNYTQTGIILAYEDGEWVVDLEDQTPVLGAVLTLGPNTAVATGLHGVLLHFDG
ncbi:MAG: hypothetical protein ACK2UL_02225, partial [Anaerolineae bacterium]